MVEEVQEDPMRKGPMSKLQQLTGRKESLGQIQGLLYAKSAQEAKKNAETLYKAENIKKHYGERPDNMVSPPPGEERPST
eukprot:m51a1_g7589 hypothetical protein (80) ;mRNA; r:210825-211129